MVGACTHPLTSGRVREEDGPLLYYTKEGGGLFLDVFPFALAAATTEQRLSLIAGCLGEMIRQGRFASLWVL